MIAEMKTIRNMPTVETTANFIKVMHEGQRDKSGRPYHDHPISVMENLPDNVSDDTKFAALLHDILEDTGITRHTLEIMGYSKETLDIVDLVTDDKSRSYLGFVKNIIDSGNQGAILVKWADMTHNLSDERLHEVESSFRFKVQNKYRVPYGMLCKAVEEFGYDLGDSERAIG